MGAFVGDSIGSLLEGQRRHFSEEELENVMSMPGGGQYSGAPGQGTDDTEMSMCLMHGLIGGHGRLDLTEITKMYGKWFESNPVDIGHATKSALQYADPKKPDPKLVMQAAQMHCSKSESNGSLMRITPMAVWTHKLPE